MLDAMLMTDEQLQKTQQILFSYKWTHSFAIFLTLQNKVLWSFLNTNTKINVVKRHVTYLSLQVAGICDHLLQSTEKVVKFYNNILRSFANICYHKG